MLEERLVQRLGAAVETFPGQLCAARALQAGNACNEIVASRRLYLKRSGDERAVIGARMADEVERREGVSRKEGARERESDDKRLYAM